MNMVQVTKRRAQFRNLDEMKYLYFFFKDEDGVEILDADQEKSITMKTNSKGGMKIKTKENNMIFQIEQSLPKKQTLSKSDSGDIIKKKSSIKMTGFSIQHKMPLKENERVKKHSLSSEKLRSSCDEQLQKNTDENNSVQSRRDLQNRVSKRVINYKELVNSSRDQGLVVQNNQPKTDCKSQIKIVQEDRPKQKRNNTEISQKKSKQTQNSSNLQIQSNSSSIGINQLENIANQDNSIMQSQENLKKIKVLEKNYRSDTPDYLLALIDSIIQSDSLQVLRKKLSVHLIDEAIDSTTLHSKYKTLTRLHMYLPFQVEKNYPFKLVTLEKLSSPLVKKNKKKKPIKRKLKKQVKSLRKLHKESESSKLSAESQEFVETELQSHQLQQTLQFQQCSSTSSDKLQPQLSPNSSHFRLKRIEQDPEEGMDEEEGDELVEEDDDNIDEEQNQEEGEDEDEEKLQKPLPLVNAISIRDNPLEEENSEVNIFSYYINEFDLIEQKKLLETSQLPPYYIKLFQEDLNYTLDITNFNKQQTFSHIPTPQLNCISHTKLCSIDSIRSRVILLLSWVLYIFIAISFNC